MKMSINFHINNSNHKTVFMLINDCYFYKNRKLINENVWI